MGKWSRSIAESKAFRLHQGIGISKGILLSREVGEGIGG